jgi:hypothetical protein
LVTGPTPISEEWGWKAAARAGEKVPLVQVAAQAAKVVPFFGHLDAFGDDLRLEIQTKGRE